MSSSTVKIPALLLRLMLVVFVLGALGRAVNLQREEPPASVVGLEVAELSDEPMSDDLGESGRWRIMNSAAGLSADQEEKMEQLRSIGYLLGSVETDRRGVTIYDQEFAWNGLNVYSSGHGPEAVLMNMEGKVVHRWRRDFSEVWPTPKKHRKKRGAKWWRRVHLYENGDLLAIFDGLGLLKLDSASQVVWARRNQAHHDLEVMENGDIYVLTRQPGIIPWIHEVEPTLEDFLSILDVEGRLKAEISILDAFRGTEYEDYVFQGVMPTGDILHTNSVHVLDGSIAARIPAFREGNVLTSMNALGVVAVLDPALGKIVWAIKSPPHGQHDPTILDNGKLLLFDNRRDTHRSIIAELSPLDRTVIWQYEGSEERPFYSRTCGTAQRLGNGNTLVTESDGGRAFELTPSKRIVWEFFTPHRAGEEDEYIATVAEMVRLPANFPIDWAGLGQ